MGRKTISELKPCPFCGGKAKIGEVIPDWFKAHCADDNCIGCNTGKMYLTAQEAAESWNRRANNG